MVHKSQQQQALLQRQQASQASGEVIQTRAWKAKKTIIGRHVAFRRLGIGDRLTSVTKITTWLDKSGKQASQKLKQI